MSNELAYRLWKARLNGTLIDVSGIEAPADEAAAYAVQAAVLRLADAEQVGFKIGATNAAAIAALGVSGPFYGQLFDRFHRANGSDVPVPGDHKAILETEFVVTLARDLPARPTEYTLDEVAAAVAWVRPGFEIVATRFDIPLKGNGKLLIADCGGNMDFVLGDPTDGWKGTDLTQHPATLYVNDKEVASGHSGMSVFGHPFGAVAWLAAQETLKDRGLKSGDVITTGSCTGLLPVSVGDSARADFGSLGEITTRFVKG
jgi:2-keto-4-pentenoate hydratase